MKRTKTSAVAPSADTAAHAQVAGAVAASISSNINAAVASSPAKAVVAVPAESSSGSKSQAANVVKRHSHPASPAAGAASRKKSERTVHKCDACDYKTNRKDNLRKHLLVHTDARCAPRQYPFADVGFAFARPCLFADSFDSLVHRLPGLKSVTFVVRVSKTSQTAMRISGVCTQALDRFSAAIGTVHCGYACCCPVKPFRCVRCFDDSVEQCACVCSLDSDAAFKSKKTLVQHSHVHANRANYHCTTYVRSRAALLFGASVAHKCFLLWSGYCCVAFPFKLLSII